MSRPSILITGATSGIGLATAESMRDRGWDVLATGSSDASVATAQRALGDEVLVVRADARSMADAERTVALARERFGHLDALFLNAGVTCSQPLADVDEDAFDELVGVNFKGPFFALRTALGLLADGGAVVFTIGTGVTSGIPNGALAAATKGALLGMVPSLALELAPRRIRVNAVSPGAIETPIWDRLGVSADARAQVSAGIPFGRFGTAAEVAGTVAFLCSPDAGYVTGQNIAVAGGGGMGS